MDCTLEFGVPYQSHELLVEIFIAESKYIKFWGSDKEQFQRHMQDFWLAEISDLAFVDEFPKIVMPLQNFTGSNCA